MKSKKDLKAELLLQEYMKLEDKLALVAILIMALIFSFSAFYTNEKLLVIMIMFGFVFLFLRRIFADV